MKIIIVRGIHGRSSSFWVPTWAKAALSFCLLGLPLGAGMWIGAQQVGNESHFFDNLAEGFEKELAEQQSDVAVAKAETQRRLQATTLKLAQIQAQLARLEALGEIVTEKAELDDGEFDFSAVPALGGPLFGAGNGHHTEQDMLSMLAEIEVKIEDRALQLNMLADLIQDRHLKRETEPSGLPASKGWLSSHYGMRTDPFTGKKAWHNGVDIAGKLGSEVISVAAGVVTFAGDRANYGKMVEVTHDAGYVTRYGHNNEIHVELGDIVKKGQLISSMGNTGRSTGPHVHFEVFKHGRSVDPASYIRKTIR